MIANSGGQAGRQLSVVKMSSEFVPQSDIDGYMAYLKDVVIPKYLGADGILAITVLRRSLVAYEEITFMSNWVSGEHLVNFVASNPAVDPSRPGFVAIQRDEPRIHQVVMEARAVADQNQERNLQEGNLG